VKAQLPTFPSARCKELLGEVPDIVSELRREEAKLAPLSADLQQELATGDVPSFGPPDAQVVLVQFSDFECPYCARSAEVVEHLRSKYGTEVRLIFRQFPLPFHQNARPAAEASLAAHAQGKFWEYHDRLFRKQQELDRAGLEAAARELGLEMPAFRRALDEGVHAAAVDRDISLAERASVDGTPTLFVNGKRVANATDLATVEQAIQEAARKR
jgi:protein-disulfide isomerase